MYDNPLYLLEFIHLLASSQQLMKPFQSRLLKLFLLCLSIAFIGLVNAREYRDDELPFVEIESITNLSTLGQQARQEGKVILLEMSATYCGYCRKLEEAIIKPMLRSGDYTDYVLIRKMEIDDQYSINNINGEKTSPAQLARQMNVTVTPTLLFLDGHGNEVSERILGVNTLEYFGAYVDDALQKGQLKLKKN